MKKLLISLGAAGLLIGGAACGSSSSAPAQAASGSCPSVGSTTSCSADTPTSQDNLTQCQTALADAMCGSKFKDALICTGQNAKCGSDNKTDSTAINAACATQLSVYGACAQSELDAGTDSGTDSGG